MNIVCVCGKVMTEREVYEARQGRNPDIIILPDDRLAEIGWLGRRLLSVGAKPSRTLNGALESLVDQMAKFLSLNQMTMSPVCAKKKLIQNVLKIFVELKRSC